MSAYHCVLETLEDSGLNQVVPFTVSDFTYTRDRFAEIRRLMLDRPDVFYPRFSQELVRAGVGAYNSHNSAMYLPFDEFTRNDLTNIVMKSLIVHECIHAIQDKCRATWMTVETAESAAYIGQLLFRFGRVNPPGTGSGTILHEAHLAAERIRNATNRNLRWDEIGDLRQAVRGEYDNPDATGVYDGITVPPRS